MALAGQGGGKVRQEGAAAAGETDVVAPPVASLTAGWVERRGGSSSNVEAASARLSQSWADSALTLPTHHADEAAHAVL